MGHGRWGIENRAFNLLTRDDHLRHCFHHHPVAIVAWLLITLLALNLTTLFVRLWIVARAGSGFTVSGFIRELYGCLGEKAAWVDCLDSG
jgi:hypothetical protein